MGIVFPVFKKGKIVAAGEFKRERFVPVNRSDPLDSAGSEVHIPRKVARGLAGTPQRSPVPVREVSPPRVGSRSIEEVVAEPRRAAFHERVEGFVFGLHGGGIQCI